LTTELVNNSQQVTGTSWVEWSNRQQQ